MSLGAKSSVRHALVCLSSILGLLSILALTSAASPVEDLSMPSSKGMGLDARRDLSDSFASRQHHRLDDKLSVIGGNGMQIIIGVCSIIRSYSYYGEPQCGELNNRDCELQENLF